MGLCVKQQQQKQIVVKEVQETKLRNLEKG
jgi:hypothetical protein